MVMMASCSENVPCQAFTIDAALLNNDLPVLNSLSVKLSQFVNEELTNMQSNKNDTSLVKFGDVESCVAYCIIIFYGRQPTNTYLMSLCFVKSTVIVAVVYGY